MKICFVNVNAYSVFNPRSNASVGGTEVQLFSIAKFLSQQQFEVLFITGDWGQKDIEIYSKIKVFKSFSLEKNILNYIIAPFLLWTALKKTEASVYVASSAGIEIGIVALFCKVYRKKFIYRTAHDWDCTGEYIKKNGVFGIFFRFGLLNSDVIVAQNQNHVKLLNQNYGLNSVIIKNAWEVKMSELYRNKKYVLWVARCEKWKNPNLLLKIAEVLHEYQFIMISPKQDEEFFDSIEKKASQIKNIFFIEKVPFYNIQKYFDEAKVFVGTSEYEGFPNTYIQACIGGTPIVSYKVNPDNFITQNEVGYCADGSVNEMIIQIKNLLNDEKDWKKKSMNALRYVKDNHDIAAVGEQWKNTIYNVVKK